MKVKDQISIGKLRNHTEHLRCNDDPGAYLATVYLNANMQLNQAIDRGKFQRPDMVSQMARCFISNYLDSQESGLNGSLRSWHLAFLARARPKSTMLQHLLLGLNALFRVELPRSLHAAFSVEALTEFRDDFVQINSVLAGQYALVWRWILESYGLKTLEENFENGPLGIPFGLMTGLGVPRPLSILEAIWLDFQKAVGKNARIQSFQKAEEMHKKGYDVLFEADESARSFGMRLYRPSTPMVDLMGWLRDRESGGVGKICAQFDFCTEEV